MTFGIFIKMFFTTFGIFIKMLITTFGIFFKMFIMTFGITITSQVGRALVRINSAQPPDQEEFLTPLLPDIASKYIGPVWAVRRREG